MQIVTICFEQPLDIIIGDTPITLVTFKSTELGHVKFGIDAPKNIKVNREEVYQAIKEKTI